MARLSSVWGHAVAVQAASSADNVPLFRVIVRVAIAALIAVFLAYIVIEQVGSWKRRRSGRD